MSLRLRGRYVDGLVVRKLLAWAHLAMAQMLRLQRDITYGWHAAAF
jgi:hypothetical protein